jgi:prolyl-tRNA editing enzyme YbaK/EbsC (Cys-tRNA(Pro) deacylase)
VVDAFAQRGETIRVTEFAESSRTAEQAATAIGTSVPRIVTSLGFLAGDTPIPVLASATNRVDTRKVAALAGQPIRRADADAVRAATGFAIGGVPPLGHLTSLPTLLDEDLWDYDELWAAAGTPYDVFAITADQLQAATGGRRATVRR